MFTQDATPATVLADVVMGESPRWHEGRLWFSDWGAREIVATDGAGGREVMARMDGMPFCFDALPDGRLLIVSPVDRSLLRRDADGALSTYADLGPLHEKAWNDIVVDGRGYAYVNNVGFDFPQGEFTPGIVAVVAPDGSARQVADDVAFPNGMAVTADNATLIVAESYGRRLTAFDIGEDGGLSNRRVWADLGVGTPDGICVDAEGAVWYADVPNKRCVRVREGGEVLQTVSLDRGCFACALGGPDRRTLYMVAAEFPGAMQPGGPRTGQVLALPVEVPGAGWP